MPHKIDDILELVNTLQSILQKNGCTGAAARYKVFYKFNRQDRLDSI